MFADYHLHTSFSDDSRTPMEDMVRRALELAGPGDAVVLAGKGHEGYIEARGTRRAFSEWAVLEEYFRGTAKPAG